VLGADAVIVRAFVDQEIGTRPTSAGLAPLELENVELGLREHGSAYLDQAFEGALHGSIELGGESLGTIHALQRAEATFDHRELIHTFASQCALAIALRRRPPVADDWLETWRVLDRLVLSVHNQAELSATLAAYLGPLFGGARCGVMIADKQRNVLQAMPGAFGAADQVTASHRVSFFDPHSNSARVLTTGRPYISNASEGDLGIRQGYVNVFGIDRVLTVPLRDVGVLHLADADHDFDLDDLERALALAPRIASIVEVATRLFDHERRQRLEQILAGVGVAVASGDGVRDFLPEALRTLRIVVDASLIAFVGDDDPPIAARSGGGRDDLERLLLDEAGRDPGVRAYVVGPEQPGDPGWAVFYVPVHLGRTRVGTLAALRDRGEPFAREERESFARLANLIALSHATARYQQQRAQVARLQERQKIGDDLHDDVAQILFAAQLSLDGLLAEGGLDEPVAERIRHARGLLIRGDTTIRNVISKLSKAAPAADLGSRLVSVASGVEDEFSIAIRLEIDDDAADVARTLRRPAADALVKVARETLVNAAKHAGPCRVDVRLEVSRRNRLTLEVSDDGRGFGDLPPGRHGLSSLRELLRDLGGSMRVCHRGQGGTRVVASLPLAQPAVAAA
jgi:signal transduction histidine kinase